jgi:hypothetical protein
LGLLSWVGNARGDSLVLSPTSEAFANVTSSPIQLSPPINHLLFTAANPQGGTVEAAFEYDISAISTLPQGAGVYSAILSLQVAGSQARYPQYGISQDVYGYADNDGVVTASDFGKALTFLGNTGPLPIDAPPGSVNIPFSFDARILIQSLADDRTDFVGFLLSAGSTGVSDWANPILTIDYFSVPEPSSVLLLGLGFCGALVSLLCRFALIKTPA